VDPRLPFSVPYFWFPFSPSFFVCSAELFSISILVRKERANAISKKSAKIPT
jgi:hypothetical protein